MPNSQPFNLFEYTKGMKNPPKLVKDWKYYTGMTCMVLALVLPLFGFLVPMLDLPILFSATIIGILTVGGPEIMVMLGAILLGKQTAYYYKEKFLALFKKKPGRPKRVSKGRYYFGLTLFFGSVLPLYLYGFFPAVMPVDEELRYVILVSADLVFVLSFFILGGEFWEKIKNLFIWEKNKK